MITVRILTIWAETTPLDLGVPGGGPRPGDLCADEPCGATFEAGERVFHVCELPDELYVCHRHEGPPQ